jgi:uncharacterized protein YbaA (DUF1428 family)
LDHLAITRSEKRGHEESHGRSSHAAGNEPFDGKRMIYGGFEMIVEA